jgi:hypothetical protein
MGFEADAEHRDSQSIAWVHLQSNHFSHINLTVEILNSFLNDRQEEDSRKAWSQLRPFRVLAREPVSQLAGGQVGIGLSATLYFASKRVCEKRIRIGDIAVGSGLL